MPLRAPTTRAACGLGCCATTPAWTNKHFARTQLVHAKAQLGIPVRKPRRSGVGHGFLLAETIPYRSGSTTARGAAPGPANSSTCGSHTEATLGGARSSPAHLHPPLLLGDGAPFAGKTFLNLGVGLADQCRDRQGDGLFELGRSQYIPMIKAWDKEETIYSYEKLVHEQLASVCLAPIRVGPLELKIKFVGAASDFKFLWLTHNLGGTTSAFRSPSHLVSMGKFHRRPPPRAPPLPRRHRAVWRRRAPLALAGGPLRERAGEPSAERDVRRAEQQSSENRRSPFGCNYRGARPLACS